MSGAVLDGLERVLVHNRLRAGLGLRLEMPLLLNGVSLPAAARTLELGAGLGWGTRGLLERFRPALAIVTDFDATILPSPRAQLAARARGTRVVVAQTDAKRLPFPDASFDLVLALYILHHVMGWRAAIAEIARVTKPGGRFALVEPVRLAWMPRLVRLAPLEGVPTAAELRAALREARFAVERWRGLPFLAYVVSRSV